MTARGENLPQSFQIAEEAAKEFSQNVQHAKVEALLAAGNSINSRPAAKAYLDAAKLLMEQARADDDYESIIPVLPAVRRAYAEAQEPQLTKAFSGLADQLERQQTEFQAIQPAVQTLKEKPEDPNANTAVGKFYCFLKQDWNRGLPMLVKGADTALAEAAKKELAPPAKPGDQAALGDAWVSLAKASAGASRTPMERKAFSWYTRALPGLTGKDQEHVEKQVVELTGLFPESQAVWSPLNLAAAKVVTIWPDGVPVAHAVLEEAALAFPRSPTATPDTFVPAPQPVPDWLPELAEALAAVKDLAALPPPDSRSLDSRRAPRRGSCPSGVGIAPLTSAPETDPATR